MTLYEKIMVLYPTLKKEDFLSVIRLQDNSDGLGAFIALWEHPEFTEPTQEQLDSVQPPIISLALLEHVKQQTQMRLDNFAKTRGYDGILSLATYATSTVVKFQQEGLYGVTARDQTWDKLYEILGEIESGTRPVPQSFEEIEPELPQLTWPE